MPVEARAPNRNANAMTGSRLRPVKPAFATPSPMADKAATIHSSGCRAGMPRVAQAAWRFQRNFIAVHEMIDPRPKGGQVVARHS